MYYEKALENKKLHNPKAKVAFLMGAYCSYLMTVQAEKFSGNKPFFKKLKDLRMSYDFISKELYTQAYGKVRQHQRQHITLEMLINKYSLEDTDEYKLSDIEANYWFVMGSSYMVKNENKKEKNNKNNAESEEDE
jgi:hypothetical protein